MSDLIPDHPSSGPVTAQLRGAARRGRGRALCLHLAGTAAGGRMGQVQAGLAAQLSALGGRRGLAQHQRKGCAKFKRKRASWNNEFVAQLIDWTPPAAPPLHRPSQHETGGVGEAIALTCP